MAAENTANRSPERQSAIADFYHKYRTILHRYFFRRVHSHAEADDLTQDLLVRITQQMDRQQIENPDVFVFTVAANLLRDRGRHLKRLSARTAEFELNANSVEVLSPERVLVDKQSLQAMLKHLDKLATTNPRACEIFILHRVEGLKHAELAQIYGIAVSTVEKDIMRAMAHLAKSAHEYRD